MPESVDTVVVGAGLAGLAAAHTLTAAGQTVRILEADDAVGGRTRTGELADGVLAEFGGEWIGPQHRHMLSLATELGVHVRRAGQLGHPILWRGAARTTVRRVPVLPLREELALLRACWQLDRLGRTVDPVQPWLSADATELDGHTLAEWLRTNGVTGDGFRYLATVAGALLSADIEHVSLLHVLWWLARGDGLLRILRTTFAYNLADGAQTLSTRLATRLDNRVTLNCPVHRITETDGVQIQTSEGNTIHARDAVVTAPVGTLAHITFDPPLPAALAALDDLRGKPGTKVTALLPERHRPRHRAAIGGTMIGAAWRVGPRITGYAGPEHADDDADLLTKELASLFNTAPTELRARTVYRWNQHRYIPACDIGFAPGQLPRHGPHLTQAHGHIHFAGAERSSWPNNMEGAVESGTNTAQTILTS